MRSWIVSAVLMTAGIASTGAQQPAPPQAFPVQPVPNPANASRPAPELSPARAASTATAVDASAAQGPVLLTPPESYRLQTGDSFMVDYRRTPEYNQTVTVQPDGLVTLDLLGSLNVRGLTVPETKTLIESAAAKRLRDPELSIELKDWEKPHYTVLGEVNTPGRFELRGPLTVEDGLAVAGGLKVSARHTKIVLIHRVNDTIGETQLVDVRRLERNPKPGTELLALQPGDILVIPTSKLAHVERYVRLVNFGVGSYIPIF